MNAKSVTRMAQEAVAAPWWARFSLALRYCILTQSTLTVWLLLNVAGVSSLTGDAQQAGALVGHVGMAVVVALGWLDVIINDLPHRWHAARIRGRRILLYSAIGMLYMVEAFVAFGSENVNGSAAIAAYYVGVAIGCAWTAALQSVRSEAASA